MGGGCLQGCNGYLLPSARIVAQLHQPLRHQRPSSSNVDEVNSHKQVIFIDLHTRAKKKLESQLALRASISLLVLVNPSFVLLMI